MYGLKVTTGNTRSPWLATPNNSNKYSELNHDVETGICIIGAGISGLTIAYRLIELGHKVVVIDSGYIGSGETGRTTAHLSNALDDRYCEIEKALGAENAKLAAESHTAAINYIENIINKEKIDCDFKRIDGYLFLSPEHDIDLLKAEKDAAIRAGITDVEIILEPNLTVFNSKPVLRFPQQAQFHPLKYLYALAQAICQKGGKIFINTHAASIEEGKPVKITTESGIKIHANHLVIATNAPIFDKSFSFAKQVSNRTYVIAASCPKNTLNYALYWDTADPYHYVRLQPYNDEYDLLIVGGEDHRTGEHPADPNAPFTKLEQWTKQYFPQIHTIEYKWSGQIQEPVDYLAYIGRISTKDNNIYIVTGDSGNGMTHGTLAGLLIGDLIIGLDNNWEKLYSPGRTGFSNFSKLVEHNLKSGVQYLDYLTGSEVSSVNDIKLGEGAIIRDGLKKVAVYRDEKGNVHQCSAICTHMKALLRWNSIEKSWDCPAHGSRFAPCGKVIQGPAACDLKD